MTVATAWAYQYDNEAPGRSRNGSDFSLNGVRGAEAHADSQLGDAAAAAGIPLHLDDAKISVNIWLTPNEYKAERANFETFYGGAEYDHPHDDCGGGGLILFDQKPPGEWDAKTRNQRPDLLSTVMASGNGSFEGHVRNVSNLVAAALVPKRRWVIPYQFNRMVVFESQLIHQTPPHRFWRQGAIARRINLTSFFDEPKKGCTKQQPSH